LILGGSISAGWCCVTGSFSNHLENFVAQYKNSYVLNRAVAGIRPLNYLGDSYEFELQPWPNVILIEIALNSDLSSWETAQHLDNLLFTFDEKYITNGLSRPDVIFLDLFSVRSIISSFKEGIIRKKIEFNIYNHLIPQILIYSIVEVDLKFTSML